jgi:hypothetical protein
VDVNGLGFEAVTLIQLITDRTYLWVRVCRKSNSVFRTEWGMQLVTCKQSHLFDTGYSIPN